MFYDFKEEDSGTNNPKVMLVVTIFQPLQIKIWS